jgi:hypothetical protein
LRCLGEGLALEATGHLGDHIYELPAQTGERRNGND